MNDNAGQDFGESPWKRDDAMSDERVQQQHRHVASGYEEIKEARGREPRWTYTSAGGRPSSEVRNSFSFLLFGNGDVGGGDYNRSPKPDWFETGLRPRRRETDCRVTSA